LIKENDFNGLIKLQNLSLVGNKITELKENTFNCLIELKELSLYCNEIKEFPCKNLYNLKKLYISSEHLTETNKNSLKKYLNYVEIFFG